MTLCIREVADEAVTVLICPNCRTPIGVSTVGEDWGITGPSSIAAKLLPILGPLEREELHVLLLNTRNRILVDIRIYQGNVSSSIVRVGELFTEAIKRNATSIVLAHNHPSGDCTPSPDDLRLTAEVLAAGRLLDIKLLDHLIIGGSNYASLRDRGIVFD
jgi:DNA repair protein RadC